MKQKEIIKEKLLKIQIYLTELQSLSNISFKEYTADFVKRHAIEKIIELIVESAIDINNIIIAEKLSSPSKDYYSSFKRLVEAKVYKEDFAEKIAMTTGVRNRLVHEYEKVDNKIVHRWIKKIIVLYKMYVEFIEKCLNKIQGGSKNAKSKNQ